MWVISDKKRVRHRLMTHPPLFLCRHISFIQHQHLTFTIKLSQYNIGRNAEVVVYVSCNIKINCTTSMENIT